jgi:hypothetical protein
MLQQDERSGFLKYGRSIGTNNRIALIDATDFISFELSELYLNTDAVRLWITRPSERLDLRMILSTKCDENVSFVEAFLSVTIYRTGICIQGQRFTA